MNVLILAAGYGTRLYPHTKKFPKSLLKVGGRPLIDYLLDKANELKDVKRIFVITNNKFHNEFQKWKRGVKSKYPILIINDGTMTPEDRLGAIGDMYFVFNKVGYRNDFLVLGGDNIFSDSLIDFVRFAREKKPSISIGLFDVKFKKEACHYGVVCANQKKKITAFFEKPKKPTSTLVAMCLYYFPKSKLPLIQRYLDDPYHSHDTAGAYIHWLAHKDKVYGFNFKHFWFDIGHVHTYEKVGKLLEGRG